MFKQDTGIYVIIIYAVTMGLLFNFYINLLPQLLLKRLRKTYKQCEKIYKVDEYDCII